MSNTTVSLVGSPGEKILRGDKQSKNSKLEVNTRNITDVMPSKLTEQKSSENEIVSLKAEQVDSTKVETQQASQNRIAQADSLEKCAFRIEKPHMPGFSGDVQSMPYLNQILNT